MLDVGVLLTTFVLIFVAELPDKSAIASLVLGTRFKLSWVFTGVAAAFAVHVVIAVAAGRVLRLLPHTAVEIVVAILFLLGAVLIWREGSDDDSDDEAAELADVPATAGFWKVASLGFGVIFIGEWGDLTQIMTANLAAKYHDPLAVGIGAVLGLWAVALTAMLFGKTLLRVVPIKLITRIAAFVLVVLAIVTLIGVING
ncbi:TMEM165/GDT1 family protein [Nocardioides sp. Kera G14]|uniref:TMEM165/GDT1 family protein n=1 Tax=Nocardioides sp. Kera G14 TaxID=2884264 RepID=UPI001D12B567|nr:TMEM165/GDT1 family protein [Nocardioides sp. Kera G14]UDY24797.1 TMEM165/GDT1 family protein [Nocardioides sp. Kera G14]